MEFSFSAAQVSWRRELREFFQAEIPADGVDSHDHEFTRTINRKLADRGWLVMGWPVEFGGGGASPIEQLIFHEEYGYHRGPNLGPGVRFIGPALISHGSEEQKRRFLVPISRSEIWWCQGFSEPGTGSDLASLQTRAVREGDEFVVNGTKIWTSNAHVSDWCWLAVRTDPEAPKHQGISILLVDMNTPGMTLQPIINMAGVHSFNQVFFDDVRVPASNLVGPLNRGWYVLATTLDYERAARITIVAEARRTLDDIIRYASETSGPGGQPIGRDAVIANKLANAAIEAQVARLFAYQVISVQQHGRVPSQEASILKAYASELVQRVAQLGMEILGPLAPLREGGRWTALRGRIAAEYLESFSSTLASGTSEIQRTIIATRGLGMPRG